MDAIRPGHVGGDFDVSRLVFAPHAVDDLDRLTEFLLERSPEFGPATAPIIASGLEALKVHPLMGRPVVHKLRELLISHGRSGYVALYQYDVATDTAIVLALRHLREGGFDR